MSELAEDFKALKEHNKKTRAHLEKKRMYYAIEKLTYNDILFRIEHEHIVVLIRGVGRLDFFPYTGWFQGRRPLGKYKGRGLGNLIESVKEIKNERD